MLGSDVEVCGDAADLKERLIKKQIKFTKEFEKWWETHPLHKQSLTDKSVQKILVLSFKEVAYDAWRAALVGDNE